MKNRIIFTAFILLFAGSLHAQMFENAYNDFEKVSSFEDIPYPYPVNKQSISNNIKVAYMDQGKGDQTIVFIHGLGSYAPAWQRTMEGLKSEYRCIAIDLPGYGKSSKGNYSGSMSFYAGVLKEFTEALGLENVILAGHSMGGQISMVAALKYPELVNKLVLIAPAGIETFTEGEKEWFRDAITAKGVTLTTLQAIETNIGGNFYKMPDAAFFMVRDRYAITGAGDEFLWYANVIPKNVRGMVNEPVYRDLPNITQPTLVVFGEADQLIPNRFLHGGSTKKIAEIAGKRIPNSTVKTFKKAGHFVMFEKADEVNDVVRTFLRN